MDPRNNSSMVEDQTNETEKENSMQNTSDLVAPGAAADMVRPAELAGPQSPGDAVIEPECGAAVPASGTAPDGPQAPSFVYALGTVEARFPSLGVDREFAQAVHDGETANLTDQQVLHKILRQQENRYLAREICWVFSVEHIDTYVLVPQSETELTQLVEAIKPGNGIDVSAVIGTRGPLAPAETCNGLQVPMVSCTRIYSFEVEEFVEAIPKPRGMKKETFADAARELFLRLLQLTDNAGELAEHRAVNYLALRYPAIYSQAVEMFAADHKLSGVDVRPSRLGASRQIVDVIFSYVDRKTDVTEKFFVRVDVSEKFPFLVSKLQPFYDR